MQWDICTDKETNTAPDDNVTRVSQVSIRYHEAIYDRAFQSEEAKCALRMLHSRFLQQRWPSDPLRCVQRSCIEVGDTECTRIDDSVGRGWIGSASSVPRSKNVTV